MTASGPPHPVPGRLLRKSFIEPGEHGLNGSDDVAGSDLLFPGRFAGLPVRMQSHYGSQLPVVDGLW